MAEDVTGGGGAGGGTQVAQAYASLMMDMSPWLQAMNALPSVMQNPLTRAGGAASGFLTDTLDKSLSHFMSGRFGELITHGGEAATRGLANVVSGVFTTLLGQSVGQVAAWLPTTLISTVGNAVSSLLGGSVTAVLAPIKGALSAPLSDFTLWTTRAVEAEAALSRFEATARMTGETTGFTAAQLKLMAEGLSNAAGASIFSAKEMRGAEQALLQFDRVRGQVFRRVMELAPELAALKNIGIEEAVNTLGMAMSDPEHGARRLRRAGVVLSGGEMDDLKRVQEVNGAVAAQEKLLGMLEQKWHGLAAAQAGTTEGLLASIRSAWAGIGTDVGNVFLPLTKVLSEGVLGVVRSISGTARPVLRDMAAVTQGWADSIRGFLRENEGTFHEWGGLVRDIVANVYQLGKDALGSLFAQLDTSGARSFWDSFKSGVSETLTFVRGLTSSWEVFKAGAEVAWLFVKDKALTAWEAIINPKNWSAGLDSLKSGFKSVFDWLVGIVESLSDFIGQRLTSGILDALTGNSKIVQIISTVLHIGEDMLTGGAKGAAEGAAAARQRVLDALANGPASRGETTLSDKMEKDLNDKQAARQDELKAAVDVLKLHVAAADALRQAGREERDQWGAVADRLALMGVQGRGVADDLKSGITSSAIKDLYGNIQKSLKPEGNKLEEQRTKDTAEIKKNAEKTVEHLKEAIEVFKRKSNVAAFGF